jgi:uncharacterized RDD family membrane protein YckC
MPIGAVQPRPGAAVAATLRPLPDETGEPTEEGLIGLALATSALVSSLAAPVLGRGDEGPRLPHMFTRVVEQVVPTVVGSVDIDALIERVDLNHLLDRIDIDGLLDRIDIDRLLARVDVQALIDRIDVGDIVERVDLDALLAEVDITALLDRIDVAAVAERAEIGELVSQSTRDVAGSTLDLARRQLVAIDLLVLRLVQRVLHKRGARMEAGPQTLLGPETTSADEKPDPRKLGQVTGRFAGAATRLAEFAIDAFMIVTLFGVAANVVTFLVRTVLGIDVDTSNTDNNWWLVSYLVWALLYFWVSTGITGRTIGKWLVGVRIVERDGSPLRTGPALVRVLVLPVSLASFGLGLVGIVIGRERRAWHDMAAGTVVVYDWGDRPAEMPAPLSKWLSRQGALELPAPAVLPPDDGLATPQPTSVEGADVPHLLPTDEPEADPADVDGTVGRGE